jgi:hypothetical protein
MALIAVCLPSCYSLFRQFLARSLGFLSSSAAKQRDRFSGRNAESSMRRDAGTKLDGLESDMIPLGAPMVTTDIHVEFEERDPQNYDSSKMSRRS